MEMNIIKKPHNFILSTHPFTTMQGRVDEMGLMVVCSYWILLWAYICSMYQQQVQHQKETLSSPKGSGCNIMDGEHYSYSMEQLIYLRTLLQYEAA